MREGRVADLGRIVVALGILILLSALTGTSVAMAIRAWPQADE